MKITITIESEGQITIVEKECEGFLTDVADAVSNATTAAFGYTVEAGLVTEYGAWDREGLVSE